MRTPMQLLLQPPSAQVEVPPVGAALWGGEWQRHVPPYLMLHDTAVSRAAAAMVAANPMAINTKNVLVVSACQPLACGAAAGCGEADAAGEVS